MEHNMKLKPQPFALMKQGKKTVELRLYDEKRKGIAVGDLITFTQTETGELLRMVVTGVHRFIDFFELYKKFDKISLGYTENEQASAEDMYAYYPREEIVKYGVVALSVKRT